MSIDRIPEKIRILREADKIRSLMLPPKFGEGELPPVANRKALLRQRADRNEALNSYRRSLAEQLSQDGQDK